MDAIAAAERKRVRSYRNFLAVGAVNTVASYAFYLLLASVLSYQLAYAFAYCIGVVISLLGNSKFVFGVTLSVVRGLRFSLFYCLSYLAGASGLHVLVEDMQVSPMMAPVLVIILMLPINYVGSKLVLRGWNKTT